ncbi:sugar kinase [Achromobacter ruhlandii]|uniref:2-dehydro-3-deoxygluconokinase n=2 Tax=Achromobacter ruhlandii TaxID=72557 RepID=A0ABM8LNZ3_9BURK|nr:sugar kinase [Achromobacter ruhlandii]AKP88478.1 2-dehydro-3-deoxygluconate kinase [Achromobacter xylosoxidans]AOU96034.1 2-dehydro-3-deoxygluconate kinase [Achromobacter ruhlandii]MCZ8431921.1 sugar kinase [Achromobacter ruhlandii]MDC6090561.1 sugar kinase [Achromobacter ruhlandii]MDC6149217.1 sugar kinase [Achromobacter ruhlandii]
MADFDIVALGEPLVELNQTSQDQRQYLQGFGGDTSNAVIAAARQGARCAYLTRVGDDAFGAQFMALWRDEGVDTSGVEVDAAAHTGLYFVQHGPDGHAFSYLRRGSAASLMTPASLDGGLIERARFLHVSGISLAISTSACDTVFAAIARARAAGVQVSLDSNLRLRLWPLDRARAVLREALCHADLFLPSMDDMQHLTGNDDPERTLDWIRDAGATGVVVLKLGKDGSIIDDGKTRTPVAALRVDAVDATGAGDCFAGSLLARRCQGDDWADAVRYANVAAALSTLGYGAVDPLPRAEQVLAKLRG